MRRAGYGPRVRVDPPSFRLSAASGRHRSGPGFRRRHQEFGGARDPAVPPGRRYDPGLPDRGPGPGGGRGVRNTEGAEPAPERSDPDQLPDLRTLPGRYPEDRLRGGTPA